ncbi:unnamed protein product [Acanthoscelides obtectus]|uniref:Uncharacterized protein n=1 Tax=Acanthoscelides obtectus TaxID=200917 RepID=A0A9P0L582_ACAOB|nr:unnamed protein product [Acanthoscelides obtectus]CAK1672437.1 hypothetical protein AOBTE_LOCUS28891 [Acanthoscelides obtectus]
MCFEEPRGEGARPTLKRWNMDQWCSLDGRLGESVEQ